MTVYLNGEFVPEERAVVSIADRGFRYGDGLFEAVLISNGKPFRWPEHFARLQRSAEFLKIPFRYDRESLRDALLELVRRNNATEAMARLDLSRGVGPRGYAPTGSEQPTLSIATHSLPPATDAAWKLITASQRVVAGDVIARHKTSSRLLNVLAAMEARERGANEALLIDTDGHVTEGTSSNVFWVKDDQVFTPPLTSGLLPGITRALVFELCERLRLTAGEQLARAETLIDADGVFLSLTSRGVVPVSSIDGRALRISPHVARISLACRETVQRECA